MEDFDKGKSGQGNARDTNKLMYSTAKNMKGNEKYLQDLNDVESEYLKNSILTQIKAHLFIGVPLFALKSNLSKIM